MKDDIIIHSVMFLTFMALLAQGHGSKDGDVKKGKGDRSFKINLFANLCEFPAILSNFYQEWKSFGKLSLLL